MSEIISILHPLVVHFTIAHDFHVGFLSCCGASDTGQNSMYCTLQDVSSYHAVVQGSVYWIRPVMMTVAGSIVGLFPVMLSSGTGSELMRRIAAPMVGGMVSATVLTLIVIPAIYALLKTKITPKKRGCKCLK